MKMLLSAIVLLMFDVFSGFAEVKISSETGNDKVIIMENETIRMAVDASRGGRLSSFIHKPDGKDIVIKDSNPYMGLFLDHMWGGEDFPGELVGASYETKVVKNTPDEVTVKVWRKMSGEWQGVFKKTLQGLVMEKTFTLKAGIDAVLCHIAVRNSTGEGRLSKYWLQNVCYIGGDYNAKTDISYRPTVGGVVKSFQGSLQGEYVRKPYAGWSATVDTPKNQALVWIMDYNDLDFLYNNGGNQTLEWVYDKIPIPGGKAWETDVVMVPVSGIHNIAHASKHLVAGLEVTRQGKEVKLLHQLCHGATKVEKLTLVAEVFSISDNKKTDLLVLNPGKLSAQTKEYTQTAGFAYASPLMVTVTASGREEGNAFQERYVVFYSGGYGFCGENLQPDGMTSLYKVDQPAKKQVLMKPEKIERKVTGQMKVFYLQGLAADNYRIDQALRLLNAASSRGFYSLSCFGMNVTDFPFDYDELMSCDVIVAANVNLQSLGKLGLEMLCDYLKHGGSLVILGGKASYGAGGLLNSGLKDLLPVEPEKDFFDIEKTTGIPLRADGAHPIIQGLGLFTQEKSLDKKGPFSFFIHRVKVKKDAAVVLRVDEKPFLVVGENQGGGRVACFLGTPYGSMDTKSLNPVFFRWDKWPQLLSNTLTWSANRLGK